jgi:hypothetical protein
MPEVNDTLAKSLVMAKRRPMYFAFVPKGPKSCLLLSVKAINPKQINELKKEAGGGNVVRGRTVSEKEGVVFQTITEQKNPEAVARLLEKTAKKKGGKVLKVADVRWVKDLDLSSEDVEDLTDEVVEEDADEELEEDDDYQDDESDDAPVIEDTEPEAEDAPVAKTASAEKTAFVQRLKSVLPALHQAMTQSREAPRIKAAMEAIKKHSQAEDYAAANAVLDEAEALSQTATLSFGTWQAARTKALNDIRAVCKAIAATKNPEAKGALQELYAIIKSLPHSPATAEIAELESYIRNDDAVAAAEECPPSLGTLRLRDPLLAALETLKV